MSPRSFARLSTPLLLAGGLFTTQAHAQNQPGSLLGLVQVITSPALGVNVANDQGQPALVRAGALPVGAQPSLNVSAIQVAPVDVLPLNSTATTTPILPGVLSVSTGPGLGINLLADEPGPAVVDVGLLPLGDGAANALGVRAVSSNGLLNLIQVPGLLDVSSNPALNAAVLNPDRGPALVGLAALPVNSAPGLGASVLGLPPVDSPLSGLPPVTAQLLPGVLELQSASGLGINVLNDGGGPAVVDLGLIPLTDGSSGLRLSALSAPVAAVPEASTLAQWSLGLGLLAAGVHFKRRRSSTT